MSESDPIRAVDLFCGAGGISTGLALACEQLDREVELAAVNHWDTAIDTHEQNHPWADHYRKGVDQIKPIEVFPEGDIDLLSAAPSCTHHSKARGGKPVNPQERMAPFAVLDWIAQLRPKSVLIENVPEFRQWGPVIDGQPTRSGKFFDAWVDAVEDGLGYTVSHRELTAADYGDPTTRERLFVVARRDDAPVWPEPTHSKDGEGDTEEWRSAAEIIDWSERGQSIWTRGLRGNGKSPLAHNTMLRIAEGVRRYGHEDLEPFADALEEYGTQRDLDDGKDVRLTADLQDDIVDVADVEAEAEKRDEPFLVRAPVPEAVADGGEVDADAKRDYEDVVGLCPPVVKGQHGGSVPREAGDEPVQTVTTGGNIQIYEPEAFALPRNQAYGGLHSNATYDAETRPFHTVTAKNHDGHLVSPYLVEYYGNGKAQDVEDPLPTVTTKDRFGLVIPELYPWGLDIRYRMFKPRELAAAQGFPDDYEFAGGTKKAVTKQIGNAVPVGLATALCKQLLVDGGPTLKTFADRAQPGHVESDD